MTDISERDLELIRRYLAERLTDEEQGMLETRIVRDPDFRRELELTIALRNGMRALEARGEIERLLRVEPTGWRRRMVTIAASVGALAFVLLGTSYLIDRLKAPKPPITTAALYFERTRGSSNGQAVTWQLGATPTQLQLHLDVGAQSASLYRVVVSDITQSAKPVVVATVSPTADGEVVLALDDSRLSPGTYEIRITSVATTAGIATNVYRLQVTDR